MQELCGVYSPFTIEANYNNSMPACTIPFSTCHELAHLGGFMEEEEANFIAYLACMESKSFDFQYSGSLMRAAVELAQEWRMDKAMRKLEAMMIAADQNDLLVISGTGEVIDPDGGVVAIGSGGSYAQAAAQARCV